MLAATDRFAHLDSDQIHYHNPAGTKNMHMGRRMIVGIDRDPQAANAQDRGHRGR